jgi:formylglycine-generating enzyme required for sulfatase activity
VSQFAVIPAGVFLMGSRDGQDDEQPVHSVYVDGFDMSVCPVTRAEYARFLEQTAHDTPRDWTDPALAGDDRPVVGVSWDDAVAFCRWTSERRGRLHRLPTDAEWEKAARGGLDDARYPWGDAPPAEVMAGISLPLPGPPPAGSGPANGFGLTGLSGVVHEWCLDWHADDYYAVSPERAPAGPAHGTRRASRGGAWRHQVPWSPVAHRSSLPPALRYSDYGFRVVRVG